MPLLTAENALDTGSTAWMLASSMLVLLMVPGLALFYGGMVRSKNIINMMMKSFVAMGIIGVQWVVFGYALAFGESKGFIGWSPEYFCLEGLDYRTILPSGVPALVFVMFQGKFAIITPALISGAVAGRMKFSSYMLFITLWSTLVYCPLAHLVWAEGGWLLEYGVLDFAGGTVVHISSGIAALALVMMIGGRRSEERADSRPSNLPMTLLGAGLLWVGWFGFNSGSAVAFETPVAGVTAVLAFATTQTAAAMGALVWVLIEIMRHGRPSSLGMASGIVAGLVSITPAAGHVTVLSAIPIGGVGAIVCYAAVQLKERVGYDDALDVIGVHGVGGVWGALATGIFATIHGTSLMTGDAMQILKQLLGVLIAIVFGFLGTVAIAQFVRMTIGLRVPAEVELKGLDETLHGERYRHTTQIGIQAQKDSASADQ